MRALVRTAVVAGLLGGSGLVDRAGATPVEAGTTGRLVVVASIVGESQLDLWTIGVDGSGPQRLTFTAREESSPKWSPSGDAIAFVRNRDVYVVDADGSDARLLTPGLTSGYFPQDLVWSPDGSMIALLGQTDRGVMVWVVQADGSGYEPVASQAGIANTVDWSADSSHLVFGAGGFVRRVNADGTGLTTITNGTRPLYAPDGDLIAFQRTEAGTGNIELWVTAPDGVPQRRMFAPAQQWQWSPDGERFLILASQGRQLVLDLDGTKHPIAMLDGLARWGTHTGTILVIRDAAPPSIRTALPDGTDLETVLLPAEWGHFWAASASLQPRPCTIRGTDDGETLVGTTADDVICGFDGNDVIRGRGGNDVLLGGAGDDDIYGDTGRDDLVGDAGTDTLYGGAANDRITATDLLAGDTMNGGTGSRDWCNGDDDDTLTACEVDPSP